MVYLRVAFKPVHIKDGGCANSTDSSKSPVTCRSYRILRETFCRSDTCIYSISGKICEKQYVVETGDLRRRINNHRFTIQTKRVKKPVAEHFNLEGHSWEDILTITPTTRMQTKRTRRLRSFTGGINKLKWLHQNECGVMIIWIMVASYFWCWVAKTWDRMDV